MLFGSQDFPQIFGTQTREAARNRRVQLTTFV